MADNEGVSPSPSTRARDHMANERTYLAWLRTAATVMALGVAVASFADDVSWESASAGAVLVVVGAAGIVYGTRRYRQVTRELEADSYLTGTKGRAAVTASAVLIAGLLVALVLVLLGRS
jgi:putative membrane protein